MERRKIIGAAVFSAAIAGGGIAGVVLGSPTSSSAATASGAGATSPGSRPAWGTGRFGLFGHRSGLGRGFGLAAAAKAIGVSDQTLLSDLKDGKTIAQVAAAKGVTAKTVIDAMVAAATTQIDAQVKSGHLNATQATDIKSRLTAMITAEVNGTFRRPYGPGGPHGPARGFGFRGGFGLDMAAKAIGVSDQTLLSDLKAGKTIAQVAASKGVATKTVIDAMVAAATREFAAQVKAGHLTAAQAATIDANLTQMITNQVNGTFRHPNGPGGMGAGGGPGGFGGPFGGAPGGPFGGAPGGPTAGGGASTPTSVAPTV
jgi:D-Tyr-tRNAtyr deacylase